MTSRLLPLLVLTLVAPILIQAGRRRSALPTQECHWEGQILCGKNWRSYRMCVIIDGVLQPKTYFCAPDEYFDPNLRKCIKIPGGGKAISRKTKKRCKKLKLHANPENANVYLACTPIGVIVLRCPEGQRFDKTSLKCKQSSVSNLLKHDPTPAPIPPCTSAGSFPIPGSPRMYYVCTKCQGRWKRTIHECPHKTRFCSIQLRCVDYTSDDPNDSSMYPPCTQLGWFRVPNDCRRYYSCIRRCRTGKLFQTRFICPEGQAFSLKNKVCLPSELVEDCSPLLDNPLDIYPCTHAGKYPLPDLMGYYTCIPSKSGGFEKKFTQCPPDHVFCMVKQKCVIINPRDCETTSSCAGPGWFADLSNCGYYYHCVPNTCGGYNQTYYKCPEGEGFDAEYGKCTSKALMECLNPTQIYTPGTVFVCKNQGTFATYDCSGYCTCTFNKDGTWIKSCVKCSDQERYSEELGICTSPENSNCIPEGAREFYFECKHAGLFAAPMNINAYVICTKNLNGSYTPTLHYCPCGTYFNLLVGFCVPNSCDSIVVSDPVSTTTTTTTETTTTTNITDTTPTSTPTPTPTTNVTITTTPPVNTTVRLKLNDNPTPEAAADFGFFIYDQDDDTLASARRDTDFSENDSLLI